MARINTVASARKTQGKCCKCSTRIEAGDTYYWVANRIGRSSIRKVFCSNHRPRPSDTTTSDKLSQLYSAQESVEDAMARTDAENHAYDFDTFKENLISALEDAAQTAEEVAEAYRESVSNMPDNLQQSSTAQDCEDKADQCDSWKEVLEQAKEEIESYEPDETGMACICGHAEEDHKDRGECTREDCDCLGYEADGEIPDHAYEEVEEIAQNAASALEL